MGHFHLAPHPWPRKACLIDHTCCRPQNHRHHSDSINKNRRYIIKCHFQDTQGVGEILILLEKLSPGPGGLHSVGLQQVGHGWAHACTHHQVLECQRLIWSKGLGPNYQRMHVLIELCHQMKMPWNVSTVMSRWTQIAVNWEPEDSGDLCPPHTGTLILFFPAVTRTKSACLPHM